MTLTESNRPMDASPLDHETVDAFRSRLRGQFLQQGLGHLSQPVRPGQRRSRQ
jgi:hypothetical protein